MQFSLIVKFPGFLIVVMMDQISKLLKPEENGRCILDEMHASLLYFKVIFHVTLMWYREYLNWIDRA